jgi:sugar transferase EpsL
MVEIQRIAKRALDVAVSGTVLLAASPLLLSVGAALHATGHRPVIFRQVRPGLRGERFTILKFRTMTDARDEHGRLLPDDRRLTALGRFVRAASIDELPQLLNVLRGEMSLVGPRPLLVQYLERYNARQAKRHDVKPGISGWAQVNGRNAISWEEKFELDVWYVENWSLFLDLKILALTALKVVRRTGISQRGQATMSEFMGSGSNPSGAARG